MEIPENVISVGTFQKNPLFHLMNVLRIIFKESIQKKINVESVNMLLTYSKV